LQRQHQPDIQLRYGYEYEFYNNHDDNDNDQPKHHYLYDISKQHSSGICPEQHVASDNSQQHMLQL
jgi:hypothetical protein